MGGGEDDPPAMVAAALERPRHVALGVAAVAIGKRFVAELEGAEEDHPAAGVGKQDADRPLRALEGGELKAGAVGADAAEAGLVGGEDGMAGAAGAELD